MNAVDIIIICVLAAGVAFAIFMIIRNKKKGNSCCSSACSGNCSSCGCTGCSHKNDQQGQYR